jgi:hypothetical protein
MADEANAQYVFKQAAHFGKGAVYSKGIHRVPPEVAKHHYFQSMLKAGLIIKAGDEAPPVVAKPAPAPGSLAAQQKAAIDARKVKPEAKPEAEKADDDDADEEEEKPVSKVGKRK